MSGEATQQGWNCSRRFLRINVSAHCGLGVCLECGYLEWPVRRRRSMGNGISRNPSGTLNSGQCSRTSVDWRSRMCQMGAKVERCRSPWCTGSRQDDDPKGVGGAARPTGSMMMPAMIDGLPWVLQYTVVEKDIPGLLLLSFQEKQAAMINLRTNKLHLPRLRAVVPMHRTPGGHRTIDDGIDTSHLPRTTRNSTAIWADLASVCDGNHS